MSFVTNHPSSIEDPISIQSPYWLNNSCSPFTSPNSSCVLGNLANYAINVSSAQDVIAGLRFAKDKNIRLSIKSTGHDYSGRGAGLGSLGLWTHHLDDISFLDSYNSTHYTGSAVRLGAGVMAYQVYEAASKHKVRVVGGFCPTVGLVGGYVQGAGHGPLASAYGLAADNTLEFEVVTTEGQQLIATPTQNRDLYWALNGDGGGTYAVVISQTTKTYADGPVGGGSLFFNDTGGSVSFWSAIAEWQSHALVLDRIDDFQSQWSISNTTFGLDIATWPGANASAVAAALEPFTSKLQKLNITYLMETSSSSKYYTHYAKYTPGLPYGTYPTNDIIGGRLIPRSSISRDKGAAVTTSIRSIAASGFLVNGIAANVTHARVGNKPGSNAVLPAWRDSLYWLNFVKMWDPSSPLAELHAIQAQINDAQDALKAVTPGSGAYVNEATFDNPAWKQDYYGRNYGRLLRVKRKYDPGFMLYGRALVGNDYWRTAADGRLCRAI